MYRISPFVFRVIKPILGYCTFKQSPSFYLHGLDFFKNAFFACIMRHVPLAGKHIHSIFSGANTTHNISHNRVSGIREDVSLATISIEAFTKEGIRTPTAGSSPAIDLRDEATKTQRSPIPTQDFSSRFLYEPLDKKMPGRPLIFHSANIDAMGRVTGDLGPGVYDDFVGCRGSCTSRHWKFIHCMISGFWYWWSLGVACYTYYSLLHISYEWLHIYVAILPLWVGKASCINQLYSDDM